jgi:hypothetical protein
LFTETRGQRRTKVGESVAIVAAMLAMIKTDIDIETICGAPNKEHRRKSTELRMTAELVRLSKRETQTQCGMRYRARKDNKGVGKVTGCCRKIKVLTTNSKCTVY